MKKIYIYLMAGLVLAGCSKATDTLTPQRIQEPESQQQQAPDVPDAPDAPDTFTLKVETVATKALIDNGQTLGSEWKQGDSISVYNSTTEEDIEGWLKATTDGPTTVFEGTVSGNINLGDILVLRYLTRNYENQDGTLEGLAKQCDYACAQVEVTGIDSEAKTISTEQANFEKVQAVVKFSITNRKENPEAVNVKSFSGTCKLPFSEFPISIHVTPQTPTNELYVAIPPLWNLDITFEAEGADGYAYRLIVPEVSFEEGLYYRRTLQMKRKALVKAPVAKTNLTYNASEQALVDAAHVYWKANDQEVILDNDKDFQQDSCVISYFVKKEVTADMLPDAPLADEEGWNTSIPKQTHAGTYYVWTKMKGNYDYEDADVSDTPVKVVIAKATPTIGATAVTSDMTYNGQSQDLLSAAAALKMGETVVTTAKDAADKECSIKYYVTTDTLQVAPAATDSGWKTSYSATHAGAHFVWIMTEGNGDMNAATATVSKQIKKATATVTVTAASGTLTYNGNKQNLLSGAATLKIGSTNVTSAKDAADKECSIQYYVSTSQTSTTGGSWGTSYNATNADTLHVWVRVTGNKDINDISQAYKVSKVIAKKNPSFSLASSSVTFGQSDAVNSTKTVNITYDGDGTLSASSNDTAKATASISNKVLTITRKSGAAGTVTITVTPAAGANYNAATGKPVTVTLTANDTGVALGYAKPGYKVASNGKAYAPTASIPTDSELVGVIVRSGVVMKAVDQGTMYNRNNCKVEDKHSWAETGYEYYISSLTGNKTQKNWILGSREDYQSIFGGEDITSIQSMLTAAGAKPLTVGGVGYGVWCYKEDKRFLVSKSGASNYVNFYNWDNSSENVVRYIRLIFFY